MRKNMKKLLLVSSVCALSLGCSSSVYAGRVYNAAEAGDLVALRRFVYTENESVNDRNRYDDNKTALMVAAYKGHFKVVEFLVDNGADVNARNKYGVSVLGMAACKGHFKIVELLVDNGADVNAKDEDDVTVLFNAASSGNFKIVELLVDNGADVNARDTYGRTPLIYAAKYGGSLKGIEVLVDNGADVNARDKRGRTPLTLALENGYTDVVKYLKKHGAV